MFTDEYTLEDAQRFCESRGYNLTTKEDGTCVLEPTPDKLVERRERLSVILAEQRRRLNKTFPSI